MRALLISLVSSLPVLAAEPAARPAIEELPSNPKAAKVVLIAGSNFYKPGEHDYVAGCSVLADLLRQTPGVAPVARPRLAEEARDARRGQGRRLPVRRGGEARRVGRRPCRPGAEARRRRRRAGPVPPGGGLPEGLRRPGPRLGRGGLGEGLLPAGPLGRRVQDVPRPPGLPRGDPVPRSTTAGCPGSGSSPARRGSPRCCGPPPRRARRPPGREDVVAWAYDRPGGGRSFNFTGGHLHVSLGEEGYRRFLVNGVLWAAGLEVPKDGAPVALTAADRDKYLAPPPAKTGK